MITCTNSAEDFIIPTFLVVTVLYLIQWFVELLFNTLKVIFRYFYIHSDASPFRIAATKQQRHLAQITVLKVLRLVQVEIKGVHTGVCTRKNKQLEEWCVLVGVRLAGHQDPWTYIHAVPQDTQNQRWRTQVVQDDETTHYTNRFGHTSQLSWCMQVRLSEITFFLKRSHLPFLQALLIVTMLFSTLVCITLKHALK